MKRLFDIGLSLLTLLVLSPILLGAALAVFIDSGAPVFFKQIRVGAGGRLFGMFKFRSMRQGAETTGPYFTQDNDVRITRVGKFIRRTSIDELPQGPARKTLSAGQDSLANGRMSMSCTSTQKSHK